MGKLVKEDLLNDVYDLVLSAETKEEERQVLLVFKNAVEAGKDFDESVVNYVRLVSKTFLKRQKWAQMWMIFIRKFQAMVYLKKILRVV